MKALPMIALITLGVAGWQISQHPLSDAPDSTAKTPKAHSDTGDWTRDLARRTDAWGHQITQTVQHELAPKLSQMGRELQRQTQQLQNELPGFQSPDKAAISGAQLTRYEKLLCDLANAERKKRGLKTLSVSPALAEVARGHSREMAKLGYFDHSSPNKARRSVMDRYRLKFKVAPRLVAENIYKLQGPSFYKLTDADFRRAHSGWMKSPGHRANILRAQPANGPSQIGVGIVVIKGSFWATQNFSRPQ